MKEEGEFSQIKEDSLKTYYTCVKYSNIEKSKWSCMKGWFESYDDTFQGNRIDLKVLQYSKFTNTVEALKKDINDDFTLFVKNNKN